MKLYDDCIRQVQALLSAHRLQEAARGAETAPWPDAGNNQLIFRSDTAYELGGAALPALSGVLLTSSKELVPESRITLCGNDLPALTRDMPYARLALIRVKETPLASAASDNAGQKETASPGNAKPEETALPGNTKPEETASAEKTNLYQAIRKIEFTRFHINPEGFMMRISTGNHRESVRISRDALARGLRFSHVGDAFRQAYEKQEIVEAVHTIFITDPDFPYKSLEKVLCHAEDITKALDHLLQNLKMDCDACHLREICAEVEALCEEPGAM